MPDADTSTTTTSTTTGAPASDARPSAGVSDSAAYPLVAEALTKTFATRSHAHGFRRLDPRLWFRRGRVQAVKSLSLSVAPGEILGLLGPNGSGKSTTIKMALGLLAPTGGRVTLFGEPPSNVAVRQRVGYLPEESYLYRFLNADETLDFFGKLFGLARRERRKRAGRLIERVGLVGARRRPLREYSKGMARRVGLAQALINDPELLILDEPTSGLDPLGVAEVKALIGELRAEGKTIVLCSHLLADVEAVCDRVAILFEGELLACGTLDQLLKRTEAIELTVPEADAALIAELESLLARRGLTDRATLTNPRDSLADRFLRLIVARRPESVPSALRDLLAAADKRAATRAGDHPTDSRG